MLEYLWLLLTFLEFRAVCWTFSWTVLLVQIGQIPLMFTGFPGIAGDNYIYSTKFKKTQVTMSQEVPCACRSLLICHLADLRHLDNVLGLNYSFFLTLLYHLGYISPHPHPQLSFLTKHCLCRKKPPTRWEKLSRVMLQIPLGTDN